MLNKHPLVLLLAWMFTSVCFAQHPLREEMKVKPYSIIVLPAPSDCTFRSYDPSIRVEKLGTIDYAEDDTPILGGIVGILNSGPPGRTIYVDAWYSIKANRPPEFTTYEIIVGGDPIPPPNPVPPTPDPPNPNPPEPEPVGPLPDTTYDVGPALARAWFSLGSDSRQRAARAFQAASVDAFRQTMPSRDIHKSLKEALAKISGLDLSVYNQVMQKAFDDGKVRNLRQLSASFDEVAEWLEKEKSP